MYRGQWNSPTVYVYSLKLVQGHIYLCVCNAYFSSHLFECILYTAVNVDLMYSC